VTADGRQWVCVGRDADGYVYVTARLDDDGMRTVRLGNGTEHRYDPKAPRIPWINTLTKWMLPSSRQS
jgi:hypothetical protein